MYREHACHPRQEQASKRIRPEWTFNTKDVLIIIGFALGLSGLMGFGAVLLMELVGTLLH
jgi:hypothetical protein